MLTPSKALATAAATLALVVGPALAATAITGGAADTQHPSVAMIVFYDGTGRYRCSASLVSSTVLLTAAHCTDGVKGSVAVTFDPVIAKAPPSPLPVAAKPAEAYTHEELAAAGYLSGGANTHPAYSGFTDIKNWNDVGVVVLDEPVEGITPVKLAPVGYLDAYKQPKLNKTIFEVVGYGTEVRKAESGPQKPTPMTYPLFRRVAFAPGQKLTPQILQLNGNEHDNRGTGGSCFGDSGGPTFHSPSGTHDAAKEVQVTVTSYGYTSNCRYLDGMQRVDIPVVQDWLAEFDVYPVG